MQHPLTRLVQSVRSAALIGEPIGPSDGALLDAFLHSRDQSAFETLVNRHGAMVLGVCQRVIGNRHDAEDAFQAVFLVLARKAGSIVPRDLVGNWLHGVAYKTALQARSRLGRHRARERQVTAMPQPTVTPDAELHELQQLLDRELQALNEKYRVPIVLCELEGRSRRDVARQLRIPEGTLSSRLAKGRELLAKRLARHDVALAGAALLGVLGAGAAHASPARALVSATVQAAALTAAGQSAAGIVSANVVALSQGVIKAMFLDKLKVLSVMILGILLCGFGVGLAGMTGPSVQAAAPADELFVQATAEQRDEPEPLDGKLLLDPDVQKELRLSPKQIERLKAISKDVDKKAGAKREDMKGIDKEVAAKEKQIEELERQIAELQWQISQIKGGIETERSQSLGKAAPEILSAQALKRLREIQRQQHHLAYLLQQPSMQRKLKLDDEQIKKVEALLKQQQDSYALNYSALLSINNSIYGLSTTTVVPRRNMPLHAYEYLAANQAIANDRTIPNLFEVLRDDQKKALMDWIGEPYQSSSWQEIRKKQQ
jgi:RNA polymerase sigma factor (sigma-70 family)